MWAGGAVTATLTRGDDAPSASDADRGQGSPYLLLMPFGICRKPRFLPFRFGFDWAFVLPVRRFAGCTKNDV